MILFFHHIFIDEHDGSFSALYADTSCEYHLYAIQARASPLALHCVDFARFEGRCDSSAPVLNGVQQGVHCLRQEVEL
jgi:hypothetical protein